MTAAKRRNIIPTPRIGRRFIFEDGRQRTRATVGDVDIEAVLSAADPKLGRPIRAVRTSDRTITDEAIVVLTQQEVALWKEKTQLVFNEGLKDRQDGTEVLAKFKELLADVQAGR